MHWNANLLDEGTVSALKEKSVKDLENLGLSHNEAQDLCQKIQSFGSVSNSGQHHQLSGGLDLGVSKNVGFNNQESVSGAEHGPQFETGHFNSQVQNKDSESGKWRQSVDSGEHSIANPQIPNSRSDPNTATTQNKFEREHNFGISGNLGFNSHVGLEGQGNEKVNNHGQGSGKVSNHGQFGFGSNSQIGGSDQGSGIVSNNGQFGLGGNSQLYGSEQGSGKESNHGQFGLGVNNQIGASEQASEKVNHQGQFSLAGNSQIYGSGQGSGKESNHGQFSLGVNSQIGSSEQGSGLVSNHGQFGLGGNSQLYGSGQGGEKESNHGQFGLGGNNQIGSSEQGSELVSSHGQFGLGGNSQIGGSGENLGSGNNHWGISGEVGFQRSKDSSGSITNSHTDESHDHQSGQEFKFGTSKTIDSKTQIGSSGQSSGYGHAAAWGSSGNIGSQGPSSSHNLNSVGLQGTTPQQRSDNKFNFGISKNVGVNFQSGKSGTTGNYESESNPLISKSNQLSGFKNVQFGVNGVPDLQHTGNDQIASRESHKNTDFKLPTQGGFGINLGANIGFNGQRGNAAQYESNQSGLGETNSGNFNSQVQHSGSKQSEVSVNLERENLQGGHNSEKQSGVGFDIGFSGNIDKSSLQSSSYGDKKLSDSNGYKTSFNGGYSTDSGTISHTVNSASIFQNSANSELSGSVGHQSPSSEKVGFAHGAHIGVNTQSSGQGNAYYNRDSELGSSGGFGSHGSLNVGLSKGLEFNTQNENAGYGSGHSSDNSQISGFKGNHNLESNHQLSHNLNVGLNTNVDINNKQSGQLHGNSGMNFKDSFDNKAHISTSNTYASEGSYYNSAPKQQPEGGVQFGVTKNIAVNQPSGGYAQSSGHGLFDSKGSLDVGISKDATANSHLGTSGHGSENAGFDSQGSSNYQLTGNFNSGVYKNSGPATPNSNHNNMGAQGTYGENLGSASGQWGSSGHVGVHGSVEKNNAAPDRHSSGGFNFGIPNNLGLNIHLGSSGLPLPSFGIGGSQGSLGSSESENVKSTVISDHRQKPSGGFNFDITKNIGFGFQGDDPGAISSSINGEFGGSGSLNLGLLSKPQLGIQYSGSSYKRFESAGDIHLQKELPNLQSSNKVNFEVSGRLADNHVVNPINYPETDTGTENSSEKTSGKLNEKKRSPINEETSGTATEDRKSPIKEESSGSATEDRKSPIKEESSGSATEDRKSPIKEESSGSATEDRKFPIKEESSGSATEDRKSPIKEESSGSATEDRKSPIKEESSGSSTENRQPPSSEETSGISSEKGQDPLNEPNERLNLARDPSDRAGEVADSQLGRNSFNAPKNIRFSGQVEGNGKLNEKDLGVLNLEFNKQSGINLGVPNIFSGSPSINFNSRVNPLANINLGV